MTESKNTLQGQGTRVFMVRHGETEWNVEGRLQGHLNSPLTENGRQQAFLLKTRLSMYPIDAIFSSDLGRCRETAEILFPERTPEIEFTPLLRERNHGIFAGYNVHELKEKFPTEYQLFTQQKGKYVIPQGECIEDRFMRVSNYIQHQVEKYPEKTLVFITHGGGVDTLFRLTLQIDLNQNRNYVIPNLAFNEFRFKGGKWILKCWADTSHLGNLSVLDDTPS